jgi:hypothetical protein
MAFFVRNFIDAEPRRVQLVESDAESAQIFLIDPFRRIPVNLRYRCGVGERHHRTGHAHLVLEPLGVGTVLVPKVPLLNATIATLTPYLPLSESEDEKALLGPRSRSLR